MPAWFCSESVSLLPSARRRNARCDAFCRLIRSKCAPLDFSANSRAPKMPNILSACLSTLNLLFLQNQQDINSELTVGQWSKLQRKRNANAETQENTDTLFDSPKTGGRKKSICAAIERENTRGTETSWRHVLLILFALFS